MKATDLDYTTTCPVCKGSPTTEIAKKRCPPRDTNGEPLATCGGTGELRDGSTCPTCNGDAAVYLYRLAELDSAGQPYYLNEPFCPSCTVQSTADSNLTTDEKTAISNGFRLKPHFTVRGEINRYQDGPSGVVRIHESVEQRGVVTVHAMPERDEDTGGFEGRYGDWTPSDVTTGPMADYEQDTKDQLQNKPIGPNGPYDVNGNTVDKVDFPNDAWPSSADMAMDEAIAWKRARGDEDRAQVLEKIKQEMKDAGVPVP